ncbi:MAG: 30S ribosomal protein S14 [Thaumarchaeota archaeon]|uniref:Putative ribosomal protein S14p/S29e n=1 Tax=uncultured marine microorganism HF4000_ANIW141A21 TaxID=455535 RepID=B3T590_9ZZZZ|nr:putative ribosomal protein S14p/S29e [uncultured marine microorganism HF4000_ANIW141A21]MCZ6613692.1 30S ribosomal protein S14 [Nitrososphaerota archaeon]MCZ6616073.1 30S ribosomal protein S14 [Nitrososphaerota archaeon]
MKERHGKLKTYGKGSRICTRCGGFGSVIQKYRLMICRQCFREVATKIGFRKFE